MTKAKATKISWWRRIIENALVSIVVSGIVSAGSLAWFESRLENSKEIVAAINRQNELFNNSQSKVFAQLGLYTGKLFDTGEIVNKNKDDLQTAIIDTQLQIARLRNELRKSNQRPFMDYANELNNLSRSLRHVKSKKDLKPVYESAQKILELHDEVAEEIRNNAEVSIF